MDMFDSFDIGSSHSRMKRNHASAIRSPQEDGWGDI